MARGGRARGRRKVAQATTGHDRDGFVPTERALTLAGRHLRYQEAGAGRPLILLHAFPLSSDLFRPQLDAPPPGVRLIAPDLRGLGGSAAAPPARAVEEHAADIIDLMNALGLDRAIIGGVSMGGYVTFAALRRAPLRVAGLILADTRPEADGPVARAGRAQMREALAARGAAAVADAMIPRLLGATTQRERPELPAEVRAMIERNRPEGIDDAIESLLTRPDSTPLLASITCPTLVICGEEDALTDVEVHTRMHQAITGSTLAVVPRAGHLSSLEQPAAWNGAVAQFLEAAR